MTTEPQCNCAEGMGAEHCVVHADNSVLPNLDGVTSSTAVVGASVSCTVDHPKDWPCQVCNPPTTVPTVVTVESIVKDLQASVDRYWELAYAEGQEGRTHDTENGDASLCRYEIEKGLRELVRMAKGPRPARQKDLPADQRMTESEAAGILKSLASTTADSVEGGPFIHGHRTMDDFTIPQSTDTAASGHIEILRDILAQDYQPLEGEPRGYTLERAALTAAIAALSTRPAESVAQGGEWRYAPRTPTPNMLVDLCKGADYGWASAYERMWSGLPSKLPATPTPASIVGASGNDKVYTMCTYCNSVEGGHTLACQAIHVGNPPKQVPIPEDSPWLQRRRAEDAASPTDCTKYGWPKNESP